MTDRPRVTMLVMTYNHERFVRECVETVLAQTYQPLEIIFSDDCSTDATYEIIRRELHGYDGPHTVVLNRPEHNLRYEHLNALMRMARGTFCVMACGDDAYFENRVEALVDVHRRTGASVVNSNALIVDEAGTVQGPYQDPNRDYDLSLPTWIRNRGNVTCFGAGIAWHRELWDHFGPLKPGPRNMDQVVPFRGTLLRGNRYIAAPLLKWRHHRDNFSIFRMRENAGSELEKLRIQERHCNNQVANWMTMFEELQQHIRQSGDRALAPHVNDIGRIILRLTRDWVDARHQLVRRGEGVQ